MADWPVPELGDRTLLQYASTPAMDKLARMGRTGMLKTVADGFHPGSEVANLSILGYPLDKVYEGRGVLEAANIGVDLEPGDMAMRCNLVCIEGEILKNHSSGNISTEEADELIHFLQEKLGNDRIHFYTGVSYRHLLVVKGGNKELDCTPPHDVPLQPYKPHLIKPMTAAAKETAALLNDLIMRSQEILPSHPVNIKRAAEGKDMASSIWPWSPGYRPQMVPLPVTYPSIKSGSVISAVDLIKGIGHYAGLHVINVEGATGYADTNYENKTAAAIEALREQDFVFLHVEASDEAGHDGNLQLKLQTIENLDHRMVGPLFQEVSQWSEPVAIALLPDHPTPCKHRTHTAEPIPFLIYYPGITPDAVECFDEFSCQKGGYGWLEKDEFMKLFMKISEA